MERFLTIISSILKTLNIVQEEPGYIWNDTINHIAYLCYPLKDNITEDKSFWKVKIIDSSTTNHYTFKRTSFIKYNVAICNTTPVTSNDIEATLTALYNANIAKYKKSV